jgi:hypothetical protein
VDAATGFDTDGLGGGGEYAGAGGGGGGSGGRSRADPASAGGVKMLPQSGHGVGFPADASATTTDF